jgi:hypothetical protein
MALAVVCWLAVAEAVLSWFATALALLWSLEVAAAVNPNFKHQDKKPMFSPLLVDFVFYDL